MNHTTDYNRPQWEDTDAVKRADVNAAMSSIDAAMATCGNCQVVYGTYDGTGKYGSSNPTTLTFDHMPMLISVHMLSAENNSHQIFATKGTAFINDSITGTTIHQIQLEWGANSVSWTSDGASPQMNVKNIQYKYLALLDMDH